MKTKTIIYIFLILLTMATSFALEQITDSLTVGAVVNTANGYNALSGGIFSISNGNNAFSYGKRAVAHAEESFAQGINSNSYGIQSVSMGGWSKSYGLRSVSMGDGNTATGDASFTTNYGNKAEGFASSVFGEQNAGESSHSFVTGRFNLKINGNANTWNDRDYLFVVGNGANDLLRNNALTILKNGNLGINVPNPISPLAVVKLPNSPPDRSGVLGRLCITVDGNVFVDSDGGWC